MMNLHRLDLVSLSLFCAVARAGSISKGAEELHIAVAAASRRLTELEANLNVSLLDRHSRGVEPTAAGIALQRHSERILEGVRNLVSEMTDYSKGVIGIVRLWTNTAAIGQGLSEELASFEKDCTVRVEMQEQDSAGIVLALLDGRADLGLVAEGTPLLGLETALYKEDRLVLAVPAGHPLEKKERVKIFDTLSFEFISLPIDASLSKRLLSHYAEYSSALRIRFHVRSYEAMWHMVGAGLGIAILPRAAARAFADNKSVVLCELDETWASRGILIAARSFDGLSKPSHSLLEHLRAGRDE